MPVACCLLRPLLKTAEGGFELAFLGFIMADFMLIGIIFS